MFVKLTLPLLLIFLIGSNSYAQGVEEMVGGGRISGNFQMEAQTYTSDSLIGVPDVKEKLLSNGFFNLNYSNGSFSTGLRYEAYMNPILGLDPQYKGSGISYRYADWKNEFISITVGDFYEQFGSGMIFRSYEERALGVDNAVDGFKIKLRPTESVELTALIGKQRNFWGKGDGIVRGGNINVGLNELLSLTLPFNTTLGASVVSKFQNDDDPFYILPENVLAYSLRLGLSAESFLFDVEYGFKYNDPNSTNNFSYDDGYGLILSGSYFTKGFSVALTAHKLDNMDFRSDRGASGNNLMMTYIPPINKQNAYKLPNMFPFATKLNGEAGMQADINYVLPAKSTLGGKYGTTINLNFSRIQAIEKDTLDEFNIFKTGNRLFYQDLSLSVSKKFSSTFKANLTYMNLTYDKDILENEGSPKYGKIFGNIFILDGTQKIDNKNAVRFELQYLLATQDSTVTPTDNQNGDWVLGMLEYSYSPKWFVSVSDEFNHGNKNEDYRLHYYTLALTYIESATRIQLSWGRQKKGILCVGGVCRQVPATNGLYLSISTSF